jgi:hypothetical protein
LSSDTKPLDANATLAEKQAAFKYYLDFAHTAKPSNLGRIVANYEATDLPYSIAKDIYLTTGDSAALELALIPYVGTRLDALTQLLATSQDDKAYVGVMLGSYLLQMIGQKDNINWERLCDSTHIDKIKRDVSVAYIDYLGHFEIKRDGTSLEPQDKHYPFFAAMANLAKPHVLAENYKRAKENMKMQLKDVYPAASELWGNESHVN